MTLELVKDMRAEEVAHRVWTSGRAISREAKDLTIWTNSRYVARNWTTFGAVYAKVTL